MTLTFDTKLRVSSARSSLSFPRKLRCKKFSLAMDVKKALLLLSRSLAHCSAAPMASAKPSLSDGRCVRLLTLPPETRCSECIIAARDIFGTCLSWCVASGPARPDASPVVPSGPERSRAVLQAARRGGCCPMPCRA